jgi:hypothetical protein
MVQKLKHEVFNDKKHLQKYLFFVGYTLKSQFRKSEFVMELLQIALGVGHVALGSERALFQVLIMLHGRFRCWLILWKN